MDVYISLNGQNPELEKVMDLINLKRESVVRFRDCGLDRKKSVIWALARTGSENAHGAEKNNLHLESNEHYIGKKDDEFDPTYEIIFFRIPPYSKINNLKHYPLPNIRKVVTKGTKGLKEGKMSPAAKMHYEEISRRIKEAQQNNEYVINLIDKD
ncbi:hypothetical protein [Priestia aryabhattai]